MSAPKTLIEDGGAAFPFEHSSERFLYTQQHSKGMTLRDWFAGQAVAMFEIEYAPEVVAERCYAIADAMLKQRSCE